MPDAAMNVSHITTAELDNSSGEVVLSLSSGPQVRLKHASIGGNNITVVEWLKCIEVTVSKHAIDAAEQTELELGGTLDVAVESDEEAKDDEENEDNDAGEERGSEPGDTIEADLGEAAVQLQKRVRIKQAQKRARDLRSAQADQPVSTPPLPDKSVPQGVAEEVPEVEPPEEAAHPELQKQGWMKKMGHGIVDTGLRVRFFNLGQCAVGKYEGYWLEYFVDKHMMERRGIIRVRNSEVQELDEGSLRFKIVEDPSFKEDRTYVIECGSQAEKLAWLKIIRDAAARP